MELVEAINKRKSIRAFKPDPVPPDLLKKIIEISLRSPSGSNSQPWEFAVVSGSKLDKIKKACLAEAGTAPVPDLPMPSAQYPEPWASRRRTLMAGVLEKLGIKREDRQRRIEWAQRGLELWEAPSCIYVMLDRSIFMIAGAQNAWSVLDCGLITQTILLLATEYGLGTIPAIQPALYPDILRKILGIPESKLIILGIPIGYADTNNPVNEFCSEREPLEKVASFYE